MAADGVLVGASLLAGVALGPPAVILAVAIVLALQALRGNGAPSRVLLALIAAALGALRAEMAPVAAPIGDLAASTRAVGVVVSWPVAGGAGERLVLEVRQLETEAGQFRPASGRVLVYLQDGVHVGPGDTMLVTWSATPAEHEPPGYASFLASQGAAGSATVWQHVVLDRGPGWKRYLAEVRRAVASALTGVLPGDAGALAAGIVTGDDSGLSEPARQAFRRTGTSHITAVSGQNIALLLALCTSWIRPARRGARVPARLAMVALVWSYALMVGLEAPALRAAIVATLVIIGAWSGRHPDPVTLLFLALGGMAMTDPAMARGPGFWLSATASFALCSVARIERGARVVPLVRQALLGVMAASVATLPILLTTFGEWSPIGPVANLIIGPILTLTFPAAYLLAAILLVVPAAAPLLAWVPAIGLEATLVVVRHFASAAPMLQLDAPGLPVAVWFGGPCAVLLAYLSKDGRRWARVARRRWAGDRAALCALLAGAAAGASLALLLVVAM